MLSAFLYRFVFTAYFVLTEHFAIAGYTPRLYSAVLSMAGVLVLVHSVPGLLRRLELRPPREVLVLVMALLVAWCSYNLSKDWMPGVHGRYNNFTELALSEPRTDANALYTDVPLQPTEWFPVDAIRFAVERVYGAEASTHVSLSADERLYAYLPWGGLLSQRAQRRRFQGADERPVRRDQQARRDQDQRRSPGPLRTRHSVPSTSSCCARARPAGST